MEMVVMAEMTERNRAVIMIDEDLAVDVELTMV